MDFRIRQLRHQRGWNQTALAHRANMSVSQISLIENGLRNPSAKSLKALANALGVGIQDLYSAEAPKESSRFPSGASVAVTGHAEPRIHWADIERWMREEGVEDRVIERVRERVLTAFIGD